MLEKKKMTPRIKYWYKNKFQMGTEKLINQKRKYRRQAAFSQAEWVTHIALRTGHIWVSCFSVNITHCWILRWSGVSGWSSGSSSDSTSLINVVLTRPPKASPSTVWKHIFFFFFLYVYMYIFVFSVASTSNFTEKAEKRHMPLSGTIQNKPINVNK